MVNLTILVHDLFEFGSNRTLSFIRRFELSYMTSTMNFFEVFAVTVFLYSLIKLFSREKWDMNLGEFSFLSENAPNSTQSIAPRILSTNALDSAWLRSEWSSGK